MVPHIQGLGLTGLPPGSRKGPKGLGLQETEKGQGARHSRSCLYGQIAAVAPGALPLGQGALQAQPRARGWGGRSKVSRNFLEN